MSNARKLADNLPRMKDSLGIGTLLLMGRLKFLKEEHSTGAVFTHFGIARSTDRYSLGINGRDQCCINYIYNVRCTRRLHSNAYKIQTTTAETSITDTEYLLVRQIIEAQNLQHLAYGTSDAKQLTSSGLGKVTL